MAKILFLAVPLLGLITVFGPNSRAAGLEEVALRLPLVINGTEDPSNILIKLRAEELSRGVDGYRPLPGDKAAILATQVIEALKRHNREKYVSACPPTGADPQEMFSYDEHQFTRIRPTKWVRRYGFGNIAYFVLDAVPHDKSFFALVLVRQHGSWVVGTPLLIHPLVQIVTAAERGRFDGTTELKSSIHAQRLAVTMRPSFTFGERQVMVISGNSGDEMTLEFGTIPIATARTGASEGGAQEVLWSEALKTYDRLAASLKAGDREQWMSLLDHESAKRARQWLQSERSGFERYCASQRLGRTGEVLVDGGKAGWLFLYRRKALPDYFFEYDVIRRSKQRKQWEIANFRGTTVLDGLFRWRQFGERLLAAVREVEKK